MTTSCCPEDATGIAFQNPEASEKYLDRILASCKDTAAGITRLLVVLALCMVAFELLILTKVTTVSVGPLQLTDPAAVTTFLPVVVAVVQYQIFRQMLRWRLLERTFRTVLRVVQPEVAENGFGVYLVPSIPFFATFHHRGSYLSRVFRVQYWFEAIVALIFALVVLPGFQMYAFFMLFSSMPSGSLGFVWIALTLSAIMTFTHFVTIWLSMRDEVPCASSAPVVAAA